MPLASASIAQVHKAKLRDGTEVVIKVRKPDVSETLQADLGFLYGATKILEYINPELSRLSLSGIVGDLRDSMLKELDFTLEAEFGQLPRVSGQKGHFCSNSSQTLPCCIMEANFDHGVSAGSATC